jgi:hypothetical protein
MALTWPTGRRKNNESLLSPYGLTQKPERDPDGMSEDPRVRTLTRNNPDDPKFSSI